MRNIYKVTQDQYNSIVAGTFPGLQYNPDHVYFIIDNNSIEGDTQPLNNISTINDALYYISSNNLSADIYSITVNGFYVLISYIERVAIVVERTITNTWNFIDGVWLLNPDEQTSNLVVTIDDVLTDAYFDTNLKFIKGGNKTNVLSVALPFVSKADWPIVHLQTYTTDEALQKILQRYKEESGFYLTYDDEFGSDASVLINYCYDNSDGSAYTIIYGYDGVTRLDWDGQQWKTILSFSEIDQSFKSASVSGTELIFTRNNNTTQKVQLPINTDDDGSSDLNAIDLYTSNIEDALNKIVSEYRATNGFYVTGDDLQGGYTKALINYWSETTADAACIVYRADDIQYWSWDGEDWVCSYGLKSINQTKLSANGFKTDVGQQGEAVLLGPGNKEVMMAGQGISVGNTQTDLFLYGKSLTYNNNKLATEAQLAGKLDANGLETANNGGDIQLLSSDGRVITQINEEDNWMDVGNMDTSLYLYGKHDRPYYNEEYLALESDIVTVKITDLRK